MNEAVAAQGGADHRHPEGAVGRDTSCRAVRKHGMSDATFHSWKSKYGLEVSEAKRLRALEGGNAKLKRLLAEAMLDNAALKDLLGKNGDARCSRETVTHLRGEFAMSVAVDRSSVWYRHWRRDDDQLREPLKALAEERRRFGYRRL